MAKAYKEGRERGKKGGKDYHSLALIVYALVTIGALFNVVNFASFIIMTFIYIYFMYEYKTPDILQITYIDKEVDPQIKDLDGKMVKVVLNVSNFKSKIITEQLASPSQHTIN